MVVEVVVVVAVVVAVAVAVVVVVEVAAGRAPGAEASLVDSLVGLLKCPFAGSGIGSHKAERGVSPQAVIHRFSKSYAANERKRERQSRGLLIWWWKLLMM
jgi:hypothetical protein